MNPLLKWLWILNFVFLIIIFIVFIFVQKNSSPDFSKNLVIIEKEWKIVKNNENKLEILKKENTQNLKSNWFFIEKNIILTSAHSVWDLWEIHKIIIPNYKIFDAKLIEKNEKNDLAKLKINFSFENFNKIKKAKNIKIWDKIFSIFYDLKTNKIKKINGKIKKIIWNKIISDLKFEKWNSGSPIFLENWDFFWINIEFDFKNQEWISIIYNE